MGFQWEIQDRIDQQDGEDVGGWEKLKCNLEGQDGDGMDWFKQAQDTSQ